MVDPVNLVDQWLDQDSLDLEVKDLFLVANGPLDQHLSSEGLGLLDQDLLIMALDHLDLEDLLGQSPMDQDPF